MIVDRIVCLKKKVVVEDNILMLFNKMGSTQKSS